MKRELIVQRTPKSPIAETFRTLRTNIQFMNSKKNLKSILITSTMPTEGKSWVAANLAITFAQAGKKVILIDADMRKGRQHIMFNVDNKPGLSNYLSGIDEMGKSNNLDIAKYIRTTEVQNLFLMPSGSIPPNPSELLASEITINMLQQLEEAFDFVIFDGTPSLIVTDALIVSRIVDSTVIVTRYNLTKKENLAKVKKNIEDVGGNIAGIILNKLPINGKTYMSTYYYSSENTHTNTRKNSPTRTHEYRSEVRDSKNEQKIKNIYENTPNATSEEIQGIVNELNKYLK